MQLPKRLVECLQVLGQMPDVSLKQLNSRDQQVLVDTLTNWRVQPNGTEGYRTAEVTLGGVDTMSFLRAPWKRATCRVSILLVK
jgi:predicted flavoprotein YhiN